MKQSGTLKLLYALAFVAFAAISCWATVESLHLLLPDIPMAFVWILTVGFFFIASYGSKLIVDSLNKHVYTANPGLQFVGGLFLLLVFWLICSMPTNTHTFYYKETIKDVALKDLETTLGYLKALDNNELAKRKVEQEWDDYKRDVWATFARLQSEANNPSRPGISDHCEAILKELDVKLGSKIGRVNPRSNTLKGWNEVIENYRISVDALLESNYTRFVQKYVGLDDRATKQRVKVCIKNVNAVQHALHNMGTEVDNEVLRQAGLVLTESYALVKQYSEKIDFKEDDKSLYTTHNVSRTTRMLSVWDVWVDFFNGLIPAGRFVFWIIISVLVDIAAFMFFDLAFKRED